MSRRVLIDAGPIVALLSSRDAYHNRCIERAKVLPAPLYTCWPAFTEAAYLIGTKQGRATSVLEHFETSNLRLLALDESDAAAISFILNRFDDQGFSLTDACLMHLAEREGIEEVFTIDQKDFSVFRTQTGRSLTIIA